MSPREPHTVPPRREPDVLTVDAGSTGALSTRFLTLVVRPQPADSTTPVSEVDDMPAAS